MSRPASQARQTISYPERRAAMSRAAILAAAETCFTQDGYAVSMDVIGKAAGVSRATLFSHFPTKEILYRSVVKAISEDQLSPLLEPLQDPGDFVANLLRFARGYAKAVLTKRSLGIHRLTVTESQRFPELSDSHLLAGIGRVLPMLEDYLVNGIERGLVRRADPKVLSEQFLVSVIGYRQERALLGHTKGVSPPAEAYVESAVQALLLAPLPKDPAS